LQCASAPRSRGVFFWADADAGRRSYKLTAAIPDPAIKGFRACARVTFFGAKKVTKENIQIQLNPVD
jgi:hypothetical protein